MSNFLGFPKPRKTGFTSPDIPSGDAPLSETAEEDVVLEGVIVDYGEADRFSRDDDSEYITLIHRPEQFRPDEDINAFLQRMMGVVPEQKAEDTVSGTFLVHDEDEVLDAADEDADSVSDRLHSMGAENEKLENFIAGAMKNIKH